MMGSYELMVTVAPTSLCSALLQLKINMLFLQEDLLFETVVRP